MAWKTLDDIDLNGKTVLTRVDLNVPMEDGRVTDATRIERIKPTWFDDILEKGGKPVLLAHFGRPKGNACPRCRLADPGRGRSTRSGRSRRLCRGLHRRTAKTAVAAMEAGEVLLLENTRFHAGEESNDARCSPPRLRPLGGVYVNDAFSAAHRAHASTEALARLAPGGRRTLDGGRVESAGSRAFRSRTSRGGGGRRGQGFDQAGSSGQPCAQGRTPW